MNAGFLVSPILVGLSLLGAVVAVVILAFRKGPKRAIIAGAFFAAVLLLLLLVTLGSEYRSDYDANPSAGTSGESGKRVEIHQYDSDRPLLSRTAAYAVGAGAVSLLILLAYLFVDTRPHGRYTWLRRGIWATAFVVVCLLLLWAGPLVR